MAALWLKPTTVLSIVLHSSFFDLSPSTGKLIDPRFIWLADAVAEIFSDTSRLFWQLCFCFDSRQWLCLLLSVQILRIRRQAVKSRFIGMQTTVASYLENEHRSVVITNEFGGGYHVFPSGIQHCYWRQFKTRKFDTKHIARLQVELRQRWRGWNWPKSEMTCESVHRVRIRVFLWNHERIGTLRRSLAWDQFLVHQSWWRCTHEIDLRQTRPSLYHTNYCSVSDFSKTDVFS